MTKRIQLKQFRFILVDYYRVMLDFEVINQMTRNKNWSNYVWNSLECEIEKGTQQ